MEREGGKAMEEKKERSFERRDELINAALIEFGDKGYENASLNNILKEAGISKGPSIIILKTRRTCTSTFATSWPRKRWTF